MLNVKVTMVINNLRQSSFGGCFLFWGDCMLSFPDIEPNISAADSCGDSYKVSIKDSTISTTTDANYKQTRPRTTRMIVTWSFSWVALSEEDFSSITDFFRKVGTFQKFEFKNPIDGKLCIVRFAEPMTNWQYVHPYGWQGSLKFEEV